MDVRARLISDADIHFMKVCARFLSDTEIHKVDIGARLKSATLSYRTPTFTDGSRRPFRSGSRRLPYGRRCPIYDHFRGQGRSYGTGVFNSNLPFLRLLRVPRTAQGNSDSGYGSTVPTPFHNVTAVAAAMAASGTALMQTAMECDSERQQATPPAHTPLMVT